MHMLKEAKRLYTLGFGCHWLKPKSKAPVKSKWTSGKRDDWKKLKAEYREGMGLGVQLGQASQFSDGTYLAVIDIDVRGDDPKFLKEAMAVIKRKFPTLGDKDTPRVVTGRGSGSGHIYVRTSEPVSSGKLGSSSVEVEVYSPTSSVSKRQAGILSAKKLARGIRLKAAWEVELMSSGKQVVLPPTIHPDTGTPYKWLVPLKDPLKLPLLPQDSLASAKTTQVGKGGADDATATFEAVDVDLVGSTLSDRIVSMVLTGEGVTDRSAAIFSVTLAMAKAGFNDNEICSVLTDQETFLGQVAYEHRQTQSRKAAAAWIRDYSLKKARHELDAANAFDDAVEVLPPLKGDAAVHQVAELTGLDPKDWQSKLDRQKGVGGLPGPIKPTLKNMVLILQNSVAKDIMLRDTFADRDFYGCDTPWGGVKGKAITDVDAVNIKIWFAQKWHIEPSVNLVFEAINYIMDKNQFHPVRDYLGALPIWDGVPRLDTWLKDYLGADAPEPYLSDVSRKFLLAAVTRIYQPGVKFDHVPILEGKQGIGKSSIGQILAGASWFLDNLPDLHDKDAALALKGRWFIEMGELNSLRKSETETVKAFITRQIDKVRPPYGRTVVEHNRQCVFFGTTNADFYLNDRTGNRRFWPVKVTRSLDFKAFAKVRDQLWAETLWCYENLPEPLYLTPEANVQAEGVREDKMAEDVEDSMVNTLTDFVKQQKKKPEAERFNLNRFKIDDMFSGMDAPFGTYRQDMHTMKKAAWALRKLGFDRKKSDGLMYWVQKNPLK